MRTKRTTPRWASLATAALLGVALLPLFGGTGAAAATPGAATPAATWAYGGQAWSNGGFSAGATNVTWNSSFGLVALFSATNTSNSTIELTEQRTLAVNVRASAAGPNGSIAYSLRALETEYGSVNLTHEASVLLDNGTTVTALGLVNASAHANATLAESLIVTHPNGTSSAFLNVSGEAVLAAAFTPALGLVPTNVSPGMPGWTSMSTVNASSSWTLNVSWARHGPLGSSGNASVHDGGWNGSAVVTLFGSVDTPVLFRDHVLRTEVVLALSGPFGLRDGFLLVPGGFDIFSGDGHVYDSDALGATAIASEGIFVRAGHVDARAVGAARATVGTSGLPLTASTSSGSGVTAASAATSPGATVTAQPESPSQARTQAACLQSACPAGPAGLGGLVLVGVGVAAVAVAVLLLARRARPGATAPLAPAVVPGAPVVPPAIPPQGPTVR